MACARHFKPNWPVALYPQAPAASILIANTQCSGGDTPCAGTRWSSLHTLPPQKKHPQRSGSGLFSNTTAFTTTSNTNNSYLQCKIQIFCKPQPSF
jgi:hypothetical protein